MDAPKIVGRNIARVRAAKGLSQTELVARIDPAKQQFGQVYLSKIENGHKNITIETLFVLAEALDVPVSELVVNERDRKFRLGHRSGP